MAGESHGGSVERKNGWMPGSTAWKNRISSQLHERCIVESGGEYIDDAG